METKYIKIEKGEYICDTDVTKDEWKAILQDKEVTPEKYLKALLKFYVEPGHKATCKFIAEKYAISPHSINGFITAYARAIQKKLNRLEVIGPDGKNCYWIFPMKGKYIRRYFEWTVRPELVQAIEELNLNRTSPAIASGMD